MARSALPEIDGIQQQILDEHPDLEKADFAAVYQFAADAGRRIHVRDVDLRQNDSGVGLGSACSSCAYIEARREHRVSAGPGRQKARLAGLVEN